MDPMPRQKRVLVVDDDTNVFAIIEPSLRDLGITATLVTSPDAAIHALTKGLYNLVLLDFRLGADLDGIDVAHRVLEGGYGSSVIVMSSDPDEASRKAHELDLEIPILPKELEMESIARFVFSTLENKFENLSSHTLRSSISKVKVA